MKKSTFLDLVCLHLAEHSLPNDEIKKQRVHIDAYLKSLGIGEVSDELDGEDPKEFANEIYEVITGHSDPNAKEEDDVFEESGSFDDDITLAEQPIPLEEIVSNDYAEYIGEEEAENEGENEYVNYAPTGEIPVQYNDEDSDDENYENDEYYVNDGDGYGDEGATKEFNVSELSGELTDEEDDIEDDLPVNDGNPIFFWILSIVLSPFWISLSLVALPLIGITYAVLLAFKILYIPMVVVVILFGSVTGIAEFVYGAVKMLGKDTEIGMFEVGICFAVVALTIVLSVLVPEFSIRVAPKAIKGFKKFLKMSKKKMKRALRKIKGACSI